MLNFFKTKVSGIKKALLKSKTHLKNKLQNLFQGPLNEELLEKIEEILYESDLGSELVEEFITQIKGSLYKKKGATSSQVLDLLKDKALEVFDNFKPVNIDEDKQVLLLIGTNGNGKTTTAAKLANYYKKRGKKVLLVAADTFRAAAVEQLETWANRLDIEIVKGQKGADPAAVVFDGLTKYKAQAFDICICDTAGRLDSKTHLMKELEKMHTMAKKLDIQNQKNYMILDATVGQNALDQAKTFNQHIPLNAIVLTKLDGSAKGGVALSILKSLNLNIAFIGTGEKVDHIAPFEAKEFIEGLFSN